MYMCHMLIQLIILCRGIVFVSWRLTLIISKIDFAPLCSGHDFAVVESGGEGSGGAGRQQGQHAGHAAHARQGNLVSCHKYNNSIIDFLNHFFALLNFHDGMLYFAFFSSLLLDSPSLCFFFTHVLVSSLMQYHISPTKPYLTALSPPSPTHTLVIISPTQCCWRARQRMMRICWHCERRGAWAKSWCCSRRRRMRTARSRSRYE